MVRLRRPGRALPAKLDLRDQAEDAAALRREPAPAGGALRAGRPARAAASPRPSRSRARSSATTISTTPTPRSSWSPSSATAAPTVRHRQARQSLRRRDARHACSTPGPRRSPATASRPSAASSPSTGRSTPRPRRRSPRSSPKSSSRPMPTRTRKAIFARKKNLRLLLTGDLPDPARGGPDARGDRRRHAGPGPRQWHDHAATSSNA